MNTRRESRATTPMRGCGRRIRVGAAVLAMGSAAVLAGCAVGAPAPHAASTRTATATADPPHTDPAASPAATSEAGDPTATVVPGGTAADNLPLFSEVTQRVWASDRRAEGRAYVDALVDAGFDKAAMQVTEDLSTVGNPAESMQFSVLWRGECLVGQVGPDIGEAVARVLPALQDGTVCLVGGTRPIDW